jgi:5-formyltetrahydrofolate cyclo-ligase
MLDALRDAGRVLLPITATDSAGAALPLRWAEYRPASWCEPGTDCSSRAGPALPPEEIGRRAWCSSCTRRRPARPPAGPRGGFYDRSLPLCDPGAALVAVVRDDELLDAVPAEAHVTMTHALTPRGGVVGSVDASAPVQDVGHGLLLLGGHPQAVRS